MTLRSILTTATALALTHKKFSRMKIRLLLCAVFLLAAASARAAVTAAERLLPADTAAIISVPDWSKTAAAWNDFPMTQLWRDPAMRKFVEIGRAHV